MADKILISWHDYQTLAVKLADQVKAKNYTTVLGLARGGLVAACLVAHQLDLPTLYSVGVRSYEGVNQQGELNFYQELAPTAVNSLSQGRFLLVDEIVDTGTTLRAVTSYLNVLGIARANYDIACLVDKTPQDMEPVHDVAAVKYQHGTWVVFPHELG